MSGNFVPDFSNITHVFLDRDGVLNRKPPNGGFVTRWEEFQMLPRVEEALAALNRSGRKVIVVTNQRGIALGLYSTQDLADIHSRLQSHLAAFGSHLDAIYFCPHDEGQCDCRKPHTGLFAQAFQDFPSATPQNSLIVGDSLRDIQAGVRLGMATVFLNADQPPHSSEAKEAATLAGLTVASLPELVHYHLTPRIGI